MVNLELVKQRVLMAMLYCAVPFGLLGTIIHYDQEWLRGIHIILFGFSATSIYRIKKYKLLD
jgi:hypothetical protein